MAKRLFVGSLPYDITNDQLQALFAQAGTVVSATVITDRMTGQSKGFAFVEMNTDEEAQKAISQLNGYNMNGRALIVNEARPREERSGGGYRGGGGGGFNRSPHSGGYRGGGGHGGFGNRGDRGDRGNRGDDRGGRNW